MNCHKCTQPISPDRLEVVPDTTLCIRCARGREPVVRKVYMEQLDPTPYIEAKIVPVSRNTRSFKVKPKPVKKKPVVKVTPKYTQIGGLTPQERKNTIRVSNTQTVPVTFTGTTTVYQYKIKTFEKTFKINRNEIVASINAGYNFYVENGILYLDRKGKKPNVRIGSFHRRKMKK